MIFKPTQPYVLNRAISQVCALLLDQARTEGLVQVQLIEGNYDDLESFKAPKVNISLALEILVKENVVASFKDLWPDFSEGSWQFEVNGINYKLLSEANVYYSDLATAQEYEQVFGSKKPTFPKVAKSPVVKKSKQCVTFEDISIDLERMVASIAENRIELDDSKKINAICAIVLIIQEKPYEYNIRNIAGFGRRIEDLATPFKSKLRKSSDPKKFAIDALYTARKLLRDYKSKCHIPNGKIALSMEQ